MEWIPPVSEGDPVRATEVGERYLRVKEAESATVVA
jgi:hypothetical protein